MQVMKSKGKKRFAQQQHGIKEHLRQQCAGLKCITTTKIGS